MCELQLTVGIMSCTALLTTLCVKGGTHPKSGTIYATNQFRCQGLSNHRWIIGGTLCLLLNQWGLVVGWACATAHVADTTFQGLIRQCEEQMIVLSDTAFHAAE